VDETERERRKEMSKYLGPRELFKIVGFLMGWIFLGIIIGLILEIDFKVNENIGTGFSMAFVITAFAFPIIGHYWKPANSLMNKVVGNKNLNYYLYPISPLRPTFKKRPWPYYLISLWRWLLLIALLVLVIKYFTK
jgi:hypothetical protein